MKAILLPLLIALTAISSLGCQRDQPVAEPTYLPLNPEFKAWCAYKPGTWWTYREIASFNTDSTWVSYYSEEKDNGPDDFYYYRIALNISSINDSFGTHSYYGEPSHTIHSQWGFIENYNVNQGSMSEGRFYYSSTLPLTLPPNTTVTQLDSFTLSGSSDIYYNIIKVTRQIPEYGNWIKTEYYARNIGVIRREMFNGEIWEIENYNIIQ